ncbi:hypothetical protein AL066_13000 [Pseudomonas nunensis]|nr:hypothetical protein AL066_13000 [Pseudomonas nunensis]
MCVGEGERSTVLQFIDGSIAPKCPYRDHRIALGDHHVITFIANHEHTGWRLRKGCQQSHDFEFNHAWNLLFAKGALPKAAIF